MHPPPSPGWAEFTITMECTSESGHCQSICTLSSVGYNHGRMKYKDTKPYMSAFLSVDLLTDFTAFCLTDFIDWRYIHSWFVFSTQLVNCCPHGRRNYMVLVYCCPSTVPSLWPPPPPLPDVQYIQTVCDCGGGGVLKCTVLWTYSAGVLHSVSD